MPCRWNNATSSQLILIWYFEFEQFPNQSPKKKTWKALRTIFICLTSDISVQSKQKLKQTEWFSVPIGEISTGLNLIIMHGFRFQSCEHFFWRPRDFSGRSSKKLSFNWLQHSLSSFTLRAQLNETGMKTVCVNTTGNIRNCTHGSENFFSFHVRFHLDFYLSLFSLVNASVRRQFLSLHSLFSGSLKTLTKRNNFSAVFRR